MRKSSLGRRSSTQIPVRVPSFGGSGSRTCSGKKNLGTLLKPGFSQNRRSQSAERESYGAYAATRPPQRSYTMGSMTPITPRNPSIHGSLPTGSARAPKSGMVSTDSARRMSSFGGGKRKDTRPISEKPFQQASQTRVQEYFDRYAPDVIGLGNSIRPMNTKIFVDMMNHLMQNLDSRIVISKSNYLEELPVLLKKFGYRSKVDRSWLMTVNTAHSWQHVVAVLSWLVDLKEIMLETDPFEMMYPCAVDDEPEESEEEDEAEEDIKIDKEMVCHLKYSYQNRKADEERLARMDEEFLEKQIIDMKCTNEDIDILQRQIDLIKEEVENETHRKNILSEELQKLQDKEKAALNDLESMKEFMAKSNSFLENVEVKLVTLEKEIMVKRAALEKKKDELQKIQDIVNTQEISQKEIEQMNSEKNNLQRMIKFYDNTIREYQNSAFNVDMKLAEDQKKLEKLVLEYNKRLAEKVVLEPQLKNCEMDLQLLTDLSTLQTIISHLKTLKEDHKNFISELESKKVECESILQKANEDEEVTREEISKETVLLRSIENEYEKQKDLTAKEGEKLKDSINHYQKMIEDISDATSQFDPAQIEQKKKKLKVLENDYQLVQKRSKEVLEGTLEIFKENIAEIAPVVVKFNERLEKLKKDL